MINRVETSSLLERGEASGFQHAPGKRCLQVMNLANFREWQPCRWILTPGLRGEIMGL